MKLIQTQNHLLLIDEEAEINTLDAVINLHNNELHFALEECLHKDNNCKKVISYYPLTKEAKELDLPLLPNPFKEEVNIEKLATSSFGYKPTKVDNSIILSLSKGYIRGFQDGYKAATKQFSLEDMKKAIEMAREMDCSNYDYYGYCKKTYTEEEIIQSLSTQQLPKEFIMKKEPIYEEKYVSEMSAYMPYCIGEKPWIITNSEGKEELVGTYKY